MEPCSVSVKFRRTRSSRSSRVLPRCSSMPARRLEKLRNLEQSHSARNAAAGSMCAARRAGRYAANSETTPSSSATPPNVSASSGVTPNSIDSTDRRKIQAASRPPATPASAIHSAFARDEHDDVASLRAERNADADFTRALAYREGDQRRDSHRSEYQSDRRECGHDDAAEPPRRESPADDVVHRRDCVDPRLRIERGDGAPQRGIATRGSPDMRTMKCWT